MMLIHGIQLTGGCDVIEATIDRARSLFVWEGREWRLKIRERNRITLAPRGWLLAFFFRDAILANVDAPTWHPSIVKRWYKIAWEGVGSVKMNSDFGE